MSVVNSRPADEENTISVDVHCEDERYVYFSEQGK